MRRISGTNARHIPTNVNLCLAVLHVLLSLYQLFVLPLYLLPENIWWAMTLLPVVALSNPFWSLIHEAIHDLFHPSRRVNLGAGRVLSICFGSPFQLLRLSHLLHHKLNRAPTEATEAYDALQVSKIRAALGYYFHILGGLYLLELVAPLAFLLPRRALRSWQRRLRPDTLKGVLVNSLMNPATTSEIRTDGVTVYALLALSAVCYAGHWELFVGMILARSFLISFLDNVYHYETPIDEVSYARNLWLPPVLAGLLLSFNLHGVHHETPSLSWNKLAESFGRGSAQFEGNYFMAALRQLVGPVPLSRLEGRAKI